MKVINLINDNSNIIVFPIGIDKNGKEILLSRRYKKDVKK